jgi:hypothetical protein
LEAGLSRIEPEVWLQLAQVGPVGDKLAARLVFRDLTERLQCALDSNNHRHLLIALRASEEELQDSQSRGLNVVTRELITRGQDVPARYLDIECQDAAGYAALDLIGGELADGLSEGDKSPHDIVERTLARWRRFWSGLPKDVLSREQFLGLFGELWFLSFWLSPRVGRSQAVQRWRGPFGARHDFEWKGKSVEVKATSSTRGRVHLINGLEQLLPPERGELLLFSIRLREEAGAANTLPSIVSICRKLFESDPDSLSHFEIGLARAGYSAAHDDVYDKTFLRVAEEGVFSVRDDFPCITESTFESGIPAGIEALTYEINLNAFDHLRVAKSPEEAIVLL